MLKINNSLKIKIASFVFLWLLICSGVVIFLLKAKPEAGWHHIYEDYAQSSLEETILGIDDLVFFSLSSLGIEEKRIKQAIFERTSQGETYSFTKIMIKKPFTLPLSKVKQTFNECLNGFPGLGIKFCQKTHRLGIYISWHNLTTHYLVFDARLPIFLPPLHKPYIAIIVDDLGYDLEAVQQLIALKAPLTYSVLPWGPYSKKITQLLRNNDEEIILHLPMEPLGYPKINPGPGALLLSMSPLALLKQLDADLNALAYVEGVNNHMGSKFTQDKIHMMSLLKEIEKNDLFFVDSLTTPKSVAYKMALQLGIPATRRDVFLDATLDVLGIKKRLDTLKRRATYKGTAVAICHPYITTIMVLAKAMPGLKKNFNVVPVSEVIRQQDRLRVSKANPVITQYPMDFE